MFYALCDSSLPESNKRKSVSNMALSLVDKLTNEVRGLKKLANQNHGENGSVSPGYQKLNRASPMDYLQNCKRNGRRSISFDINKV